MLVSERMSTKPVTITADVPITEALRIMRQSQVRRLPVLDENGALIGIVSEKDLLYASPSPATSLSIYEMHYMLSRLQVTELMTPDPVTITPDTLLEEAALIMADSKIGGLPVVQDGKLVGMSVLWRLKHPCVVRAGNGIWAFQLSEVEMSEVTS